MSNPFVPFAFPPMEEGIDNSLHFFAHNTHKRGGNAGSTTPNNAQTYQASLNASLGLRSMDEGFYTDHHHHNHTPHPKSETSPHPQTHNVSVTPQFFHETFEQVMGSDSQQSMNPDNQDSMMNLDNQHNWHLSSRAPTAFDSDGTQYVLFDKPFEIDNKSTSAGASLLSPLTSPRFISDSVGLPPPPLEMQAEYSTPDRVPDHAPALVAASDFAPTVAASAFTPAAAAAAFPPAVSSSSAVPQFNHSVFHAAPATEADMDMDVVEGMPMVAVEEKKQATAGLACEIDYLEPTRAAAALARLQTNYPGTSFDTFSLAVYKWIKKPEAPPSTLEEHPLPSPPTRELLNYASIIVTSAENLVDCPATLYFILIDEDEVLPEPVIHTQVLRLMDPRRRQFQSPHVGEIKVSLAEEFEKNDPRLDELPETLLGYKDGCYTYLMMELHIHRACAPPLIFDVLVPFKNAPSHLKRFVPEEE